MIAFDISSSMLAEDFQPQNRLEVAREKVKQFITMRNSDRIGVVAFSGEALTQVPLTTDYPVVLAAVDNLQPGQLDDGTAIGTAIATAANRLRGAPGRSRVMVLLTDGVNNRGAIDPRTAAQAAGGDRREDLRDRRGDRGHGAGAGRAWRVRPALREPAGGDRRRLADRSRAEQRAAATSARATPRRSIGSRRKSTGSSARRCA